LPKRNLCVFVVFAVAVVWIARIGWTQAPAGDPAAAPGTAPAAAAASTPAPPPVEATKPDDEKAKASGLLEILKAGGLVGVVIMLLSVGAVALVIEHIMTIREQVLMPPGMADEVRELLAHGKLGAAQQRCRREPSFLGFVLEAGMGEVDGGWTAVEKATEDAIADQSARLFRKIEYLSVIGNIAPMLGLLGTVIGMIMAFREVATTQGAARAADLAGGIYQALITTVEGLIVAIPALAAFAVFRNRVDQLVAETAYVTQHAFAPLKRRGGRGKATSAGPSPSTPTGPKPSTPTGPKPLTPTGPKPPTPPTPPPVGEK